MFSAITIDYDDEYLDGFLDYHGLNDNEGDAKDEGPDDAAYIFSSLFERFKCNAIGCVLHPIDRLTMLDCKEEYGFSRIYEADYKNPTVKYTMYFNLCSGKHMFPSRVSKRKNSIIGKEQLFRGYKGPWIEKEDSLVEDVKLLSANVQTVRNVTSVKCEVRLPLMVERWRHMH